MITAADIRAAFPAAFTADDDTALAAAIVRAQAVHSTSALGSLYDQAITLHAAASVSGAKSSGAIGGVASATAGPSSISYFQSTSNSSNPFQQEYEALIRLAVPPGGFLSSV